MIYQKVPKGELVTRQIEKSMAEFYRVRVKTENLEVEVESSDRDYVERKLQEYRVAAESSSGTTSETVKHGRAPSESKPLSIQEFIRRVAPSKDVEYVVAVAYFCEKHEQMEEVKLRDVSDRFSRIKYKHSNHSVAVSRAKEKGWLMDRGAGFVVTNTGERWIEDRIQREEAG